MLRKEVVEPELHSWVLLFFVTGGEGHVLIDGGAGSLKVLSYLLNLLWVGVKFSQVHHKGWHALYDKRAHIALQVVYKVCAVQVAQSDAEVSVDSRESPHILVQYGLYCALGRL